MTCPENIRAAFREVALGLMEWREPHPEGIGVWYPHAEGFRKVPRETYRPYDPQGEVEPYDVQADWEENL